MYIAIGSTLTTHVIIHKDAYTTLLQNEKLSNIDFFLNFFAIQQEKKNDRINFFEVSTNFVK